MSTNGYEIYVDGLLLPIAPSKIDIKINNSNKTISLINGKELNLIKVPGLTDISMDILLPSYNYPGVGTFQKQEVFLNKFEELKKADESKKVFSLVILRSVVRNDLIDSVFNRVTLEDYRPNEDTKNGTDILVSLNFKQYLLPNMKKLKATDGQNNTVTITTEVKKESNRNLPVTHTVVNGDTIWDLCKKYLGSVTLTKCYEIAKKNSISNPNKIYPGQVIKFE